MKSLIALALLVLTTPLLAQPVVSPEVSLDGRVTFRIKAPNAKEVQIRCEAFKPSPMQKGEGGVWSFTSEPLQPDIYVYSFNVDGLRALDLNNPLMKYNLLNSESQVHVPGPASLPWEVNDVPHGVIHRHPYHSAVANDDREFYVYTPPGYDPTARKKYPVLYLLHGFSDDATAWSTVGYANVILDNLIARKEAKPMIVVMPLGYGTMEMVFGNRGGNRPPDLRRRNLEGLKQALLTEVLPQVEKSYHAASNRQNRAIAGLSMGGQEALTVGLTTLDQFAWVGGFSAGGLGSEFDGAFGSLDSKANSKLQLLWVGCGKDDGLFKSNKSFDDWLSSKGIRHTWVESPGAHNFRVWRRYLAEFAPMLFLDKK